MRAASEASKISDNLFYSEGYFDGYNKQRVYPRKRTVCALGLFDGVHRGHQLIITTAVKKAQSLDGHSAVFCFKTDTVTSKGHDGRIEMLMSDEESIKMAELGVEVLFSPDLQSSKAWSRRIL